MSSMRMATIGADGRNLKKQSMIYTNIKVMVSEDAIIQGTFDSVKDIAISSSRIQNI